MSNEALLRQYWPFAAFSALILLVVLRLRRHSYTARAVRSIS